VGAVCVIVLFGALVKSKRPMKTMALSGAGGLAGLITVNLTGLLTGVMLPVSFVSIGAAAFGGIPGVIGLLIARLIV